MNAAAIRNASPAALREAARLLDLVGDWHTSVDQDASGNLFVAAVVKHGPVTVRWALVTAAGDRAWTLWCDESARREAARIGGWDLHWMLDRDEHTPRRPDVLEFDRP